MAASCAQTPALPHQEWRQGRPPPLYNKTGPLTTTFCFWPRRNRTTGTPTILLPDTRTLGQLVQPEQFNEHIHIDFTSTCVREVKLFILYKKECIIILFIISTFTKKSPATYASMLIKTNWNQNLLCYYFFLKQKFWNLNDFDTTLSFGGISWFVCTCSDNLDKSNKFSSKLHKNDIHWYTWGKWRWRGW